MWEWCGDGFALYNAAHVVDPIGMNRFQLRVARGGAFSTQPSAVRSARRSDGAPTTRYVVNGFRVVLDAESIKQRQGKRPQSVDGRSASQGSIAPNPGDDPAAKARQKDDVVTEESALADDGRGVLERQDTGIDFQDELRSLHNLRVNRRPTIEEANTIVEKLLATYPDREATIHGQAAHLFGQSGIKQFSDEVQKHALESIKTETDVVERARMFMYLSNAEEVQGKPSEANYWALQGLLELQPLNLPEVAPEPPGVGRFNDLVANPGVGNDDGSKQELYQRLSAAEKQARDSAIQVRELVRFRDIYVDILRRLNTTTEAREQLQKLARERIGSDWLQHFLDASFDRDREVGADSGGKPADELPGTEMAK